MALDVQVVLTAHLRHASAFSRIGVSKDGMTTLAESHVREPHRDSMQCSPASHASVHLQMHDL
jgi:hypothetical protein